MHVKRWLEWVSHNGLLKQALNIVGQVASKVNSPKIKMDQARFVDFVESSLNVQIVQYASSNTDSVTNVTTHRLSPMPQNSALQMQNRHSIAPHGTPHVLVFALCWTIEGRFGHSPSMIVWLCFMIFAVCCFYHVQHVQRLLPKLNFWIRESKTK